MKLAQFKNAESDHERVGVLLENGLADLAMLASHAREKGKEIAGWLAEVATTGEIIRRGADGLSAVQNLIKEAGELRIDDKTVFSLDGVSYLPAVNAGKILAIGRNYVDHATEQGEKPPESPLLFNKLPNSLNGHNQPIELPRISAKVDFEAELAVIIGRNARSVREEDALDYVFGYSLINDVSARDLQYGDKQWTRGKGLDGFAPLGPFITTRDEIADVHALKIEGKLNGTVMQSSNTSKMMFKVPFLIAYLSQGITLAPGDVIATGTPEGVGIFRDPPVLLKPGDVYEVAIEQLGTLRNEFKAASGQAASN